MPNAPGLLLAGLLTLLAMALLRRALRTRGVARTLQAIQTRPVGETGASVQQVRGRLETDLPLRSPYQQRPCVYFFFRVLVPGDRRPRTVATGKEWTLVRVRDSSGEAEVDAVPAIVSSPRRFEAVHRNLSQIPPELAGFFERAGIEERHLRRLPAFTVHEYTLEPGDEVYVTGAVDVRDGRKVLRRSRDVPLTVGPEPEVEVARGLLNEWILYAALTPPTAIAAATLAWLSLRVA